MNTDEKRSPTAAVTSENAEIAANKDRPSAKPRKLKSLSRTAAKKYFNLQKVGVNVATDGKTRALVDTSAELQRVRQKLSNACALLEAVVRRHGVQVFDRDTVQKQCARGDVEFDVTETRITMRLRGRPRIVDGLDS